jgi:hypothetical protein
LVGFYRQKTNKEIVRPKARTTFVTGLESQKLEKIRVVIFLA